MHAFPLSCFLVLSGFLGCLGLFALAVTKVASPDGQGHARGFLGGCAAMLALLLLCGLGMTGLAATVAAIGMGSVADWNPIRSIEITHAPEVSARASTDEEMARAGEREHGRGRRHDSAVSARFTVHGEAGEQLVDLLHDTVDMDLGELADGMTVQHRTDAEGGDFTVYEFRLPISEADLERFERDVRLELDGMRVRLPESVRIEFDGAR